jgi:hypothetical protein
MLMAPLVRRSWAPRGNTPILYQRTRSHKKVSVIAALCISPDRDNVHLYFRLHPDANINSSSVADFLKILSRQLGRPVVLIWDRFLPHRSKIVHSLICNSTIHSFFLPPYAPELNPVENVWGYLKMNPMANMTALDINTLTETTRSHGRSVQRKQILLRSFVKHTPLFIRLN